MSTIPRDPKIVENNPVVATYHRHPEQAAWLVLLFAFLMLCFLVAGTWFGGRAYVISAKSPYTTTVTSVRGTVLAKPVREDTPLPILLGNRLAVDELTIISTDETSQALLTFFDESSITLYDNSTLIIQNSNRPRFRFSSRPELIEIELVKGRLRATPANNDENRIFRVKTPQAEMHLVYGSYAVEADNEQTQVTTRQGQAEISAQNQTVTLTDSQLSLIRQGQPPTEASAAEQNLVVNGDFTAGLTDDTWTTNIFVPENAANLVTATVQSAQFGNRTVLEFSSSGEDNIHTDAAVEQIINKDVRDFRSLRVNADFLLNYQSLPGAGFVGTEFPIRVRLSYKDADGNDREWYHGFFYERPPDNYILYDQPDNSYEIISRGIWYPYESENLLESLEEIKPVYIKSIRIYASGWNYHTMVTDVELLAED